MLVISWALAIKPGKSELTSTDIRRYIDTPGVTDTDRDTKTPMGIQRRILTTTN